jgi:hypothetical protein
MVSWSKPLASRFLRLSRLLRLDLGPSACTDALLVGAGEDLVFVSDRGPLKKGVPPGGKIGEFIFDEGAEDPAACVDVMVKGRRFPAVLTQHVER